MTNDLRCDWHFRRELCRENHNHHLLKWLERSPMIDVGCIMVDGASVVDDYWGEGNRACLPLFEEYAFHIVGGPEYSETHETIIGITNRGFVANSSVDSRNLYRLNFLFYNQARGCSSAFAFLRMGDTPMVNIPDDASVRDLYAKTFNGSDANRGVAMLASSFMALTNYIVHGPRHLVRATTSAPAAKKDIKTSKSKPWLRSLPSHILIDWNDECAPSRDPVTSHRSPVPHQRRAHTRRLFDVTEDGTRIVRDKVFVRSSWVGPREWVTRGRQYTVVNPGQITA